MLSYIDKYIWSIEKYKSNGNFQDIGYLMLYSFALAFDVTGREEYKKVALEAANSLFASLKEGNYLICNWLENGESYAGVDSFMNIGLWIWAYDQTREPKYISAVTR
ncbi:hypothetical protein I6G82_02115 [Lysinibacillus macroides]|uniref:Uncharacterized protein n=1 Tax=Lysinibacillus macroides TaxID=33935 RepID=A0A0M9DIY5_9BACI|nr:hypothetical protein [Lysinibacillus macroides]KOY81376.1 hypothetical protein ADM90_19840 [Lysinibacillus macroides]QPR68451.1 hypothetical protein I6G82_02115 [Lysinibacillus macroides]